MIPYDMKLEYVDLIQNLLGNLFDNAIEAARKADIEEREIKLRAKMSGNNPVFGNGESICWQAEKTGAELSYKQKG